MIIGIPVVIHLPNLWHQPQKYDCIPNLTALSIFSTVLILMSSIWAIPLKGGSRIFLSKIGLLFLSGILFAVGYILAFIVDYFLAIYGVPGYDLM
jgi:hypothetical protein